MKKISLQQIRMVLQQERIRFENGSAYTLELSTAYSHYTPIIEDVPRFFEQAKMLFPNWNCGITAVRLQQILGFGKIIYGFYDNESHTFLTFKFKEKDYVADITADQFGGPAIYCGPLTLPWSITRYKREPEHKMQKGHD